MYRLSIYDTQFSEEAAGFYFPSLLISFFLLNEKELILIYKKKDN
jgi:hypothetical protein